MPAGGAAAPYLIRCAKPADAASLWSMVLELARYEKLEHRVSGSAEQLAAHLFRPSPPIECLVAEQGRALIGYAIFYATYSTFRTQPMMWLEDLFVNERSRGLGVGRSMMARLAAIALERGCWRLDWNVLDWNQPSIRFYQLAGAQRANTDWFQYGLDEAGMRALAGDDPPR
jgi:GNAT superfamily N-acetyltransferase